MTFCRVPLAQAPKVFFFFGGGEFDSNMGQFGGFFTRDVVLNAINWPEKNCHPKKLGGKNVFGSATRSA